MRAAFVCVRVVALRNELVLECLQGLYGGISESASRSMSSNVSRQNCSANSRNVIQTKTDLTPYDKYDVTV